MIKKLFVVAAAAALFSTPALASHCPTVVAAASEALASNISLCADQKAEVQSLIDQGTKQHADGDHSGSIETLQKAQQMLSADH